MGAGQRVQAGDERCLFLDRSTAKGLGRHGLHGRKRVFYAMLDLGKQQLLCRFCTLALFDLSFRRLVQARIVHGDCGLTRYRRD
jgi:hypothetical protein